MAKMAEEDGIEKIVATPHFFRDNFIYKNFAVVTKKSRELNTALRKNNIGIEIFPGAEVHISHNLTNIVRKNRDFLVLNNSSYMFVEFPQEHVFSNVKDLFFELMSERITPIIAHPERNSVFSRNPGLLFELIQLGALAQANNGSFTGLYGGRVQEAVFHFLDLRLIHFIASDGHNTKAITPTLSEGLAKAEEIIGKEEAQALVKKNPQAVLNNQEIPYFPEPINPKEKEKSIKIKIPQFFKRKR